MKDQSAKNEAAAEMAREEDEEIDRAMAALGLPPEDDGALSVLRELYDTGSAAGASWEHRYPSYGPGIHPGKSIDTTACRAIGCLYDDDTAASHLQP
jgi:hypothetical protein